MSTMQTALQEVFQPTKTLKDIQRHNRALFGTEEKPTQPMVVIEPPTCTKTRVVQVQRVGNGYWKARFRGEAVSAFGETRRDAEKNLRWFRGER